MDTLSPQVLEQAGLPQPLAGTPTETPGAMPAQNLRQFSAQQRRQPVNPQGVKSAWWRRFLVLGSALLLSLWGINEMRAVLAVGDLTFIEYVVLALFALTFSWITVAFTGAIAGFVMVIRQQRRPPSRLDVPLHTRTAVLMPTYNEQPERIFASLEAMALAVDAAGQGQAFDWFIISDTTDPDVAIAEEAALLTLRERIGDKARVYYRRRRKNIARKAGNVADFCRRWGKAYDHLLVLDADSLMESDTLIELARRMQQDPDAGLIQTIPQLINGTTLTARLQQFATRVYGPVVGTGLAWWTHKEGNFWGHNAIIRTQAFMDAAGLPDLPGKPPFGGHILSHDFVEAALIRRAGWSVIIAADLAGSYEECPPSIIDLAIRDRRWCQGNLQHSRVLPTKGLHWVSRMHLLTGIMSYLSSPLWLMLILAGLALALQAQFIRPEYFTDQFALFPSWPRMDAARALQLFVFTMVILFAPKVLGLISFALYRPQRRQAGGVLGLLASFVLEVLLSALIAPVMMLIHSGAVMSILLGQDSGWNPQRRDDGSLPIKDLIYRHRWHMLIGVFLTLAAYLNSLALLAWLSPAIAGMLLSVPLSMLTSSWSVGAVCKRWGLLRTPDEVEKPAIRVVMEQIRPHYEEAVAQRPDMVELAQDHHWRDAHLALIDRVQVRPRGQLEPLEAMAAMKIREANSIAEAVSFLDNKERALVLATPALFHQLAALPAHTELEQVLV
ncbi:glucans biosynthesis glucosyltransferase MdoH [Balneatrix alpica]|uniref:Glucans biosynthesis glucosyltransferase H n=1 Tax=Balneatrix alpica TaxID=75684 RepID=A0ABV5ZF97_9GAMM|nr:glucans biosynthesis glucosyltransferase MdoH [Balneatrix alpica]